MAAEKQVVIWGKSEFSSPLSGDFSQIINSGLPGFVAASTIVVKKERYITFYPVLTFISNIYDCFIVQKRNYVVCNVTFLLSLFE